ncbi:MAG TPA: DUF742 domain-containing protein [Pseudonocardiaceae bacterium]|nr:DUF742 domain-containing protein [Pseudonocardiaceae bacterium]
MSSSQGSDDSGPTDDAHTDDEGAIFADEWGEPEDFRRLVRPYTWTRGRTRPVQDLALETLISASGRDPDPRRIIAASEYQAVVELCAQPCSVAEVAALLVLPLGIARVLLADMIDLGLVRVHDTAVEPGDQPDLELMERVLAGLHRL